jgi:DNA polymerase II large subunit
MTNLEGALREIREALEAVREYQIDDELDKVVREALEAVREYQIDDELDKVVLPLIAKLNAILDAVPEGLADALEPFKGVPLQDNLPLEISQAAQLLNTITKDKNDELV